MPQQRLTSVELFTGAGGLALGVANAGFKHLGLYEWNRDACESIRSNALRLPLMNGWPISEGDVRDVSWEHLRGKVDLLAAGAPCQPFSLGGKHRGDEDHRNMFPQVFRAVREMHPAAVIVENVKGLLRSSFRDYFDYLVLQLQFPKLIPKKDEEWRGHSTRLLKALKRPPSGLRYRVHFQLMNAANFGVPQRRERVFIVAFREDLNCEWPGLQSTHTEDALLYAKYVSGEYWEEHGLSRRPTPEKLRARVDKLWSEGGSFLGSRWLTVRDALKGLPAPKEGKECSSFANHTGNSGAKSYPGHTGSPIDEPAKTLKAGDHGVPGGENMIRYENGVVRYFTVREAARLQCFPDQYVFRGAWGEGFRQLGNAVPVRLSQAVASSVADHLSITNVKSVIAA